MTFVTDRDFKFWGCGVPVKLWANKTKMLRLRLSVRESHNWWFKHIKRKGSFKIGEIEDEMSCLPQNKKKINVKFYGNYYGYLKTKKIG